MAQRQRILRRAPLAPSAPTLPRTNAPAVRAQAPATTARPASCPPAAAIDARILGLRTFFATHTDSDDRAAAVDRFNALVHTECLAPYQATRLLALTSALATQARTEEQSFSVIDRIFGKLAPILKIGAGGTMLLVSGLALVYVAGRNTSAGRSARAGTGELRRAARTVANPARAVYSRSSSGVRRQELKAERGRVRRYVAEDRRGGARAEAASRVRRIGPNAKRIRTVSRARARREAGQADAIRARQATERGAEGRNARGERIIPGIRVNRRRAAVRHG